MNILSVKQYARYAMPILSIMFVLSSLLVAPLTIDQDTNAKSSWMTIQSCKKQFASSADDTAVFKCINNNSTEAMVYRTYRVAFGRTPDRAGFNFWVKAANKAVKNGKNPQTEILRRMMGSSEFRNKILTGNPIVFVEETYMRAYSQKGDKAGVDYWVNQINSGKKSYAEVLSYFIQNDRTKTVWSIQAACYSTGYKEYCH